MYSLIFLFCYFVIPLIGRQFQRKSRITIDGQRTGTCRTRAEIRWRVEDCPDICRGLLRRCCWGWKWVPPSARRSSEHRRSSSSGRVVSPDYRCSPLWLLCAKHDTCRNSRYALGSRCRAERRRNAKLPRTIAIAIIVAVVWELTCDERICPVWHRGWSSTRNFCRYPRSVFGWTCCAATGCDVWSSESKNKSRNQRKRKILWFARL